MCLFPFSALTRSLLEPSLRADLLLKFFFLMPENLAVLASLLEPFEFARIFPVRVAVFAVYSVAGCIVMEAVFSTAHTVASSQEEGCDEELSVLPRHTKVIITGNNRTRSVLVGLQGVVKKAVGFGGWHWLVLKNGVEVKLQRNALSVLEAPTGNEEDDDFCVTSFCINSDMGEKDMDHTGSKFYRPRKPRVRHTKPWICSAKSNGRSTCTDVHSHGFKPETRVNLSKLETATLWRYWRHFNLVNINPNPTKEQLVHGVRRHFLTQKQLDEMHVIVGFVHAAKRLKTPVL